MGKRMVRTKLLLVLMAVALVTSITAGSAQAASYQGSSRAVAASSVAARLAGDPAAAASSSLNCTAPLSPTDSDCESTSPTVDRWVQFTGSASESCTFTASVNWGDGTSSSRSFTDPTPGVYLIAQHTYGAPAHTTTYNETFTGSVDSGTCKPASRIFHFTYLVPVQVPWWTEYGITEACARSLVPNPVTLGISMGLFKLPGYFKVLGVLFLGYRVYELQKNCTLGSYPTLPKVFSYGVTHLGQKFTPSGPVPQIPSINGVFGYQNGALAYDSITYANPGRDATGFGFVGINGAGWALENHPFSSPFYGIVGNDRIDYPYNLACGTAQEYNSWVEAWISDSQGLRSNPVEVYLSCTT